MNEIDTELWTEEFFQAMNFSEIVITTGNNGKWYRGSTLLPNQKILDAALESGDIIIGGMRGINTRNVSPAGRIHNHFHPLYQQVDSVFKI